MLEWLDVLKLSIPVLLALIGLIFNEYRKRYWQRHKRKETRYIALLKNLKGFYVGTSPATAKDDKEEFLKQASIVWLYCPDSIIRQIYIFLEHVRRNETKKAEKEVGKAVLLMRQDLLGKRFWLCDRTRLKASEYQHLQADAKALADVIEEADDD